jgi:hypothetical protein
MAEADNNCALSSNLPRERNRVEDTMKILADAKAAHRRRWFRFAYHTQGRKGGDLLPHQLRDGEAALFLQTILHERGYDYVGTIYNYPPPVPAPARRFPVDDSFLRADDLLVLTTRPPLDDADDGVKCHVDRGYTTLEEKVFESSRRHLPRCSRSNVIVADVHARAFPEVAKGASIDKYLAHTGKNWQRPDARRGHSAAYLLFEEHAWPNGPGVLAAFGMCGIDTLVWHYHLATCFRELIASVPFVMAELIAPQHVPLYPLTTDFAKKWQVRILTVPKKNSQCQ